MFNRFIIYDEVKTYIFPYNPSSCDFVPVSYQTEPFEDASGKLQAAFSFSQKVGNLSIEGSWVEEENYSFFRDLIENIQGKLIKVITHNLEAYKAVLAEGRISHANRTYNMTFNVLEETNARFYLKVGAKYGNKFDYWIGGGVISSDYILTLNANESATFSFPSFVVKSYEASIIAGSLTRASYTYDTPVDSVTITAGSNGAQIDGIKFLCAPANTEFEKFEKPIVSNIIANPRFRDASNDGSYLVPVGWEYSQIPTPSGSYTYNTNQVYTVTYDSNSPAFSMYLRPYADGALFGFRLPPRNSTSKYYYDVHILLNNISAVLVIDYWLPNSQQVTTEIPLSSGENTGYIEIPYPLLYEFVQTRISLGKSAGFGSFALSKFYLRKDYITEETNYPNTLLYTYLNNEDDTIEVTYPTQSIQPTKLAHLYIGNSVPAILVGNQATRIMDDSLVVLSTKVQTGTQELLFDKCSPNSDVRANFPAKVSKTNYQVYLIAKKVISATTMTIKFKSADGTEVIKQASLPIGDTSESAIISLGTLSISYDTEIWVSSSQTAYLNAIYLLPTVGLIQNTTFKFPIRIQQNKVTDANNNSSFVAQPFQRGTVYFVLLTLNPLLNIEGGYLRVSTID